ncbi:hypothetical protein EXIGLDRAFT_725698 [Exidia glandulosa HHB12029]|uniref:Uncharacterized protein n=1 Tax=Exidia glandulosa HHB12029 TaxID=1314781 RepID=A0A165Q8J9_EXIGL|nr:hypothetical protein EXIGLDRAFT_725698 [Exidia glandulosa HHB12029]
MSLSTATLKGTLYTLALYASACGLGLVLLAGVTSVSLAKYASNLLHGWSRSPMYRLRGSQKRRRSTQGVDRECRLTTDSAYESCRQCSQGVSVTSALDCAGAMEYLAPPIHLVEPLGQPRSRDVSCPGAEVETVVESGVADAAETPRICTDTPAAASPVSLSSTPPSTSSSPTTTEFPFTPESSFTCSEPATKTDLLDAAWNDVVTDTARAVRGVSIETRPVLVIPRDGKRDDQLHDDSPTEQEQALFPPTSSPEASSLSCSEPDDSGGFQGTTAELSDSYDYYDSSTDLDALALHAGMQQYEDSGPAWDFSMHGFDNPFLDPADELECPTSPITTTVPNAHDNNDTNDFWDGRKPICDISKNIFDTRFIPVLEDSSNTEPYVSTPHLNILQDELETAHAVPAHVVFDFGVPAPTIEISPPEPDFATIAGHPPYEPVPPQDEVWGLQLAVVGTGCVAWQPTVALVVEDPTHPEVLSYRLLEHGIWKKAWCTYEGPLLIWYIVDDDGSSRRVRPRDIDPTTLQYNAE